MPIDRMQGTLGAPAVAAARAAGVGATATRADHVSRPRKPARRAPPDYALWSLEELRAFALQMRLPGAAAMSRRELLEIFAPAARSPAA